MSYAYTCRGRALDLGQAAVASRVQGEGCLETQLYAASDLSAAPKVLRSGHIRVRMRITIYGLVQFDRVVRRSGCDL